MIDVQAFAAAVNNGHAHRLIRRNIGCSSVFKPAIWALIASSLASNVVRLDLTVFEHRGNAAVILPIATSLSKQLTVLRIHFTFPYDISNDELESLKDCKLLTELRTRRQTSEGRYLDGDDIDYISLTAPRLTSAAFFFLVRSWPDIKVLNLQCRAPLTSEAFRNFGHDCRRLRKVRLDSGRCSPAQLSVELRQLRGRGEKLFPHLKKLALKSAANEKGGER